MKNFLGTDAIRKPSYQLIVNGENITPKINARLISLTLTDNRDGEADTLEITLSDHDGQLALPPTKATIQVSLGFEGSMIDKGTYTVDEVSHSGPIDTVTIRARSADFANALPGAKSRSWIDKTLGEIINEIAGNHGLTPVIGTTLKGIRRASTHQTAESDMSLLTRLGELYDATASVKHGKLIFTKRARGQSATGKSLPPIIVTRRESDTHHYTLAERDAYGGVKAKWNNKRGGRVAYVIAGSGDNAYELKPTYTNEADALAAANAEWDRLKRGVATLELNLAIGNPAIAAESPIKCEGWKKNIDEKNWLAVNVIHTLDEGGLRTKLSCETAS